MRGINENYKMTAEHCTARMQSHMYHTEVSTTPTRLCNGLLAPSCARQKMHAFVGEGR